MSFEWHILGPSVACVSMLLSCGLKELVGGNVVFFGYLLMTTWSTSQLKLHQ
jgi:hypothetical protein